MAILFKTGETSTGLLERECGLESDNEDSDMSEDQLEEPSEDQLEEPSEDLTVEAETETETSDMETDEDVTVPSQRYSKLLIMPFET